MVYAALTGLVLAPFLVAGVPAFGDTLNHLARMHVLATLARSPDLQRFYSVQWQPIPYLAMDAIVPTLARVLPIYLAGKIFVCACVLMPALATATLHYAVHRRVSLVPAASLLLCTNYLLALGFLNYLFMSGLAVMLFAAWLRTAAWPRWPRMALFAPLVLVLYFGHAFAALAYCLCVAGFEAARALRAILRTPALHTPLPTGTLRAPWPTALADMLAAVAQAVPALAFAATLHVRAGYVGALNTEYGNLGAKLMALMSPTLLLADRTYVATAVAALVMLWVARRHVRLAPGIWPALLVVGIAAAAMPHVLASTWGMDLRLPLIAAMLLVGGMSFAAPPFRRGIALAVLLVLLAARTVDNWGALHRIDQQIAETRAVVAHLPHGARLLVVSTSGHGSGFEQVTASTVWHMPLVAVIDRDAFVPYLFNGLTTVHVRSDYRLSSTPNGLPISPDQLRAGIAERDDGSETGDGLGARLYYRAWPTKFDYVLIQRYSADPGFMPDFLTKVASSPDLDLYAVEKH